MAQPLNPPRQLELSREDILNHNHVNPIKSISSSPPTNHSQDPVSSSSSSSTSLCSSTVEDKLGISHETPSNIKLMEVDSLENVLHKSTPSVTTANYLEWEQAVANMASVPRRKRTKKNPKINSKSGQDMTEAVNSSSESGSTTSEEEGSTKKEKIEEFGLEILKEPDYHDSECDVDTGGNCVEQNLNDLSEEDKKWILDDPSEDRDPSIEDFIIVERTSEKFSLSRSSDPEKVDIIEISDPDVIELDNKGNIVDKNCLVTPEMIKCTTKSEIIVFREHSDSTMSDSENSVAVKEFLHTVHCTPKLRMMEDPPKNKFLIMEPLETIDEENADDLQRDIIGQLETYWDEEEDENQPKQEIYIFNDEPEDDEVKSNQQQGQEWTPSFPPSRTVTAAEEILLDEMIDEFVQPSKQMDRESHSDLNLSGLEFSDAENLFISHPIEHDDDEAFVKECPSDIREIMKRSSQVFQIYNDNNNEEEELEEFSECEQHLESECNPSEKTEELTSPEDNFYEACQDRTEKVQLSPETREEEEDEDSFLDALNELPSSKVNISGLGRSSEKLVHNQSKEIVQEQNLEENIPVKNSSSNKLEVSDSGQNKTSLNVHSPSRPDLTSPNMCQDEVIQNKEECEQEPEFSQTGEPGKAGEETGSGEEETQMESGVSLPEPEELSRWSHMEDYLDTLYVKVLVPCPLDQTSSSRLSMNEMEEERKPKLIERIVPFPLHKDYEESVMVLAINSHLLQLHAHYLNTPKEVKFKFSRILTSGQGRAVVGVVKIKSPLSIPVSFKLSSVYQLDMNPELGVIFPQEVVKVKIQCRSRDDQSEKDLIEQLKIEGVLVYSAPFIFNRDFGPDNLESRDVREFWDKLKGPRFRFVQTRFIPIEIVGKPEIVKVSSNGGLLNLIWKGLSYLNIFKYPPTHLLSLSPNELSSTRASPIGQVILRRHINIYRLLQSRIERLNNYRTMLIMGTIVCAIGVALFYFLIYKPEVNRVEFLRRISSSFWEHTKSVLPRLLWAQSSSLQKF